MASRIRAFAGVLLLILGVSIHAATAQNAAVKPATPGQATLEIGIALFNPTINAAFGPTPRVPRNFTGAFGLNRAYEKGLRSAPVFYQQRIGARWVEVGLIRNMANLRHAGWEALAWGFDRQKPDGSFDVDEGAVLGTAFFVASAGIALLAERQLGLKSEGEALLGKMVKSARYLAALNMDTDREIRLFPRYVHRYWVMASALGLIGELTNDASLALRAADYARAGLKQQRSDGVNPEGGRYDVGYQAAGMISASHYFTVCGEESLREEVREMLSKGGAWLAGYVDPDGGIDPGQSTRVLVEASRKGTPKRLPALQIASGLAWAALITGRTDLREAADRIVKAGQISRPVRELEDAGGAN